MNIERKPLTDKQREIYEYILARVEQSGYQPSVRDIGRRFGKFPATIQDHITAIRRKGWMKREEYKHARCNVIPNDILAEFSS